MDAGSRARSQRRSSAASPTRARGDDVADQARRPVPSSRATTAASRHAGVRGQDAPPPRPARRGSRATFTWSSRRPRNSSSPSGRQPARQVAGAVQARARAAPNGSGTKRSAVSAGRSR